MKIFIFPERLEDLSYDNSKSHTKFGFHPASGKYILGKIAGGKFAHISLCRVDTGFKQKLVFEGPLLKVLMIFQETLYPCTKFSWHSLKS